MEAHQPFRQPDPAGHRAPGRGTNPLRRTSDRLRSWCARILLVIAVVGIPIAGVTTGLMSYESRMRVAQTENAARHPVDARLVANAPEAVPTGDGADPARVPAQVRWTGSDGTEHNGTAQVKPATAAGTTIRLWVDGRDRITPAPTTPGQAVLSGCTSGVTVSAAAIVTAVLAWKGFTRLLDRRTYAQWDAEWERVEPDWSRRLRE
ncbi:Rv1733c family protein [Streptomyces sp. NPDC002577]